MVARFFLAIHKPVIPSETWESRGNERGGLYTVFIATHQKNNTLKKQTFHTESLFFILPREDTQPRR